MDDASTGGNDGSLPLIAVLTGAGISTDSGIPDYRGPQGVWRRNPEAERLVTYQDYMADPEVRRASWLARRDNPVWHAEPNAAHRALADLERSGVPVRIITQNVDGLHQKAGSDPRKVLELHGTLFAVVCTSCGARSTMREALDRVGAGEPDPACRACGGVLKSATVMFGQALDGEVLRTAAHVAQVCDWFLAVGSSLQVEPAASLCRVAAEAGARLVVVNAEPTPYDDLAAEVVREPIGTALPALLERIAG
ncbi:NAD-dependent deacetylase [Streptomyces sp. NPDC059506]|uniref:SIR2 family NAD-dependent protein deacylase n=1 Tax=unclassified Streptomyces TaxID=2593676 RepID=UPI000CAEC055|nr:Sir2 family NAD-dependent protein deacetylase [Streptomyces sp. SCUT-3]PLW66552.1 NAD-dependent deacetylase [Streptomyces sp. DJ]QMV20659.1 NAD-dependent deacetylase [Streptomyces sp. SCUT-3]